MDLLFHAAKHGKTVIRFSPPPPVSDVSVIMDPTRKGVGLVWPTRGFDPPEQI